MTSVNKSFSAEISKQNIIIIELTSYLFSHPNDDIDYTGLGDSCLATFGGHIQPFMVLEGYEGNIKKSSATCFLN